MTDYRLLRSPFYQCRQYIKSISISAVVTSIGNYACYDCSNLTSITIPNSVTPIRDYAFSSCSSLIDVSYLGEYKPKY